MSLLALAVVGHATSLKPWSRNSDYKFGYCSLTVVVDGADLMLDALHVSLELTE